MPSIQLRKKEKTYIDVSIGFEPNPLTSDLPLVVDRRAIETSMRNLVLTRPGEVPFQSDIGSSVYDLLFDMNDEATATLVEDEILRTIEYNEPRVKIKSVTVANQIIGTGIDFLRESRIALITRTGASNENSFIVTIRYQIVGSQQIFTVEQILRPTR